MADIATLERALRNADAAGDVEAAKTIAAAIKSQRPAGPSQSGFAMGLADPIHGGAQLLTKMLPNNVVEAGNRLNNWIAERLPIVAKLPEGGVDQQVREREQAYQAQRGDTGIDWARLGGNIVNPVNLAIAGAAPAAAGLAGRMGIGAAVGGASASMAPVGEGDFATEKAKQIGMGAAGGAAVPAIASGLSRIISPKASTNPDLALLKAEGVRPTIGQTLGGAFNKVEEKAMSVPIVGDSIAAARTRATEDLNKAVAARALKPIGESVPKAEGRELVAEVQKKLSGAYEELLPKLTAQADEPFIQSVGSVRQMVQTGSIDPNAARLFDRILQNDVLGKFRGQNALTGQTIKQVESDLGQKISQLGSSTDADARLVADALREVRDSLRGMVQRSNPQYADRLQKINEGWANFKRLERASGYVGAEEGAFNASQLQSAVKALDRSKDKGRFSRGQAFMQDLSDPAKTVLGSKVPNSGTADRLMNAGAIGSGLVNPAIPLSLLGGAAAYSAPGQALLRGLVSSRPSVANPIAGLLNRSSPMLGPAGGLLALDAFQQ